MEQEQHANHVQEVGSPRWGNIAVVIGIFLAMVGGVGYITDWFGLATPRFTTGVNYKFEYTIKTTHPLDKINIQGRGFVVDDQTVFSTPEVGLRGERFLVEDVALPPNTFRLTEKKTPAIVIGGLTFQPELEYLEVRYNQVSVERQTIVPNLKPKR